MMASATFMPLRAILRACKRFFEDAGQENLSAHKKRVKTHSRASFRFLWILLFLHTANHNELLPLVRSSFPKKILFFSERDISLEKIFFLINEKENN